MAKRAKRSVSSRRFTGIIRLTPVATIECVNIPQKDLDALLDALKRNKTKFEIREIPQPFSPAD
jgi:hypothetical protein